MNDNSHNDNENHSRGSFSAFMHNLEGSAILTFCGIVCLFSTAIIVTLIAPRYIDPTWTQPSSSYQVQMYEVADPHLYVSSSMHEGADLQYVHHLKEDYTLLAFSEADTLHFVSPPDLEKYITRYKEPLLKLTSRLLLLRRPASSNTDYDAVQAAEKLTESLQRKWEEQNPNWKEANLPRVEHEIYELYAPEGKEAFAFAETGGIVEEWVDENYTILDDSPKHVYHNSSGVIYVNNPMEYRVRFSKFGDKDIWNHDSKGEQIQSISQLTSPPLGFRSRKELITLGEQIFSSDGCWYCHTDQTRTLIQDVVLNGSESFPAPPSSPNEYIYQNVTFPGTRRIGPDLSRVGIKRPSRDWHKAHFWSPKTASRGSVMPAFQHFFDRDPRGTSSKLSGVPNYKFEAIFQYLMTKGTRITAPTQAWWLGKDPVQTIQIIEGRKK